MRTLPGGRRLLPILLALVAFATACVQPGAPASRTTAAPPTPSARPTPAPIVAIDDRAAAGVARLVDLNGAEVARAPVPAGAVFVGVGGGRLIWRDATALRALGTDGRVTQVGTLPALPSSLVVSPDGTGWVWSRSEAQGEQTHSVLYLNDRPITESTEPGRALQAVTWTVRGVVVEHAVLGLGGYVPIGGVTGPAELVNVQSGTRQPLTDDKCLFAALATDGTLSCRQPVQGRWGASVVRIVHPGGSRVDVKVPSDRFRFAGDTSFKPELETTTLAIGGATGAGAAGGGEMYETDIVDAGSAIVHRFGPPGLLPGDGPWAWLPDGSLISWRPPGSGGSPGVYVAGLTGSVRQITPTGRPVGVIQSSTVSGSSAPPD